MLSESLGTEWPEVVGIDLEEDDAGEGEMEIWRKVKEEEEKERKKAKEAKERTAAPARKKG